jgi:type I restriction enzyme S subunit
MPAVDAEAGAITRPEERCFSEMRKGFTAFANGDVIMAKITPCMENGKAAIARGLANGLGFGSTEFHVLRPTGVAAAEWLYYFIRQESFRKQAESEMTGSVGQKRVPVDFLSQSEIPLPPLCEQRRIVEKVEALLARVNAARARLARAPALIKTFRQAVLSAACSGKLTEEWREIGHGIVPSVPKTAPYLDENDALPEIPEHWKWSQFDSVILELKNGISTKPEMNPPGLPILRISAVRPGKVLVEECRYLPCAEDKVDTYGLRNGDLLFTRYNGSLDLLGVCGMVREIKQTALLYPDKLMRVRINPKYVLADFAELFFQESSARDRMTSTSKSSAGQQGVSGKNVKEQLIALPSIEEQHEIVRRVEALFALNDSIEAKVAVAQKRADALTQAILAKAFRGELVPTEASLARAEGRPYESAAELLNRLHSHCMDETPTKGRKRGRDHD